jgi:hypothetical protein
MCGIRHETTSVWFIQVIPKIPLIRFTAKALPLDLREEDKSATYGNPMSGNPIRSRIIRNRGVERTSL